MLLNFDYKSIQNYTYNIVQTLSEGFLYYDLGKTDKKE